MILDGRLQTARLAIRPFAATDTAALVAIFADPSVARYVDDGEPLTPEDAALWVARSGDNLRRHGYGTGAVEERASGRVIGWAGFARPEDGPEQIIYGLAAAHWRRGYGAEIVEALVGFGDARGMTDIFATVHPANAASIGLLRKYGFERIGGDRDGGADCDLYRRRSAVVG